jgi:hypothetical protein
MPDGVKIHGKKERPAPQTRGGERRLTPGMSRADYNYIESIHGTHTKRIAWNGIMHIPVKLFSDHQTEKYTIPAFLSIRQYVLYPLYSTSPVHYGQGQGIHGSSCVTFPFIFSGFRPFSPSTLLYLFLFIFPS